MQIIYKDTSKCALAYEQKRVLAW